MVQRKIKFLISIALLVAAVTSFAASRHREAVVTLVADPDVAEALQSGGSVVMKLGK